MAGTLHSLIFACTLFFLGLPSGTLATEAGGLVAADGAVRTRVADLIEQLADPNYHRRVAARWELEQIGLAAFEQLREAAQNHPDPQIERSARYLIESQKVVWWLESDSIEVRELLKSYNTQTEVDRDSLLQKLADLESDDALLALCRLARFESNELLSKSAALYLMEQLRVLAASDNPTNSNSEARVTELTKSLLMTTGEGARPATEWLNTLLEDLQDPAAAAPLEKWKQLLAAEHTQVVALKRSQPGEQPPPPAAPVAAKARNPRLQQNVLVVLRFYRWVANWATDRVDRSAALDLARPSLQLIADNALAIRTAAEWALDADLPELVQELQPRFSDQFSNEPQLGYLWAESLLKMGRVERAQEVAAGASKAVEIQLQEFKNLRNLNLDEIRAGRHYVLANQLERRGLFDWAEQEYLAALELELKEGTEYRIRENLAQFYWFGEQPARAVEVLEPIVAEIVNGDASRLPNAPGDFTDRSLTLSNYYFYLGLAEIAREQYAAAFESLRKALAVDPAFANPDVLIAMYRISRHGLFEAEFQKFFDEMVDDFRVHVVEAEAQLAHSANRIERVNAGPTLATACNQLAWLLSNCETSPEEAIRLSQRSLELVPDEPAYLDTLARCYYAGKHYELAVRTQQRAVDLAPFERQMVQQLEEFEAALEKHNSPMKEST